MVDDSRNDAVLEVYLAYLAYLSAGVASFHHQFDNPALEISAMSFLPDMLTPPKRYLAMFAI